MIRTNCFYYQSKITEGKIYPRCKNYPSGFCPCEDCEEFITKEEMERQVNLLREIRGRKQNG